MLYGLSCTMHHHSWWQVRVLRLSPTFVYEFATAGVYPGFQPKDLPAVPGLEGGLVVPIT